MKKMVKILISCCLLIQTNLNGQDWKLQKKFEANSITCIQLNDTLNGFILGFEADFSGLVTTIAKQTSDGGKNWKPVNLNYVDYLPTQNQHINGIDYFVGMGNNLDGIIGKSRNNGKNWEMTSLDFQILNLLFNDTLNGLVVGAYGNIYKTSDGSKSWKFITKALGHIYGIEKIPIDNGYLLQICGTNGLIGSSVDSGNNWNFNYNSNLGNLKSIIYDGKGTEWVCNDVGQLFRSIDTGKTWILNYSNNFDDFSHFGKDNNGNVWVCGDFGRFDLNNDTTWISYSNLPGNHESTFDFINDFVFLDNGTGWFSTNEGNIFTSANIDTTNASLLYKTTNSQNYSLKYFNDDIQIENLQDEDIKIKLYDLNGKLILIYDIPAKSTLKLKTLNKVFSNGIYLLSLIDFKSIYYEKIIIKSYE